MGNNADYPRTLIVNAHFTEQSGSGAFLGRLFSTWPEDRLATACGDVLIPDWRRCRRHYRTDEFRFPLRTPIHRWVPSMRPGPMFPPADGSSSPRASALPKVSWRRRLARYPWRALLRLLGDGEILYRMAPSPQLLRWAREFRPEVIYGHCSGLKNTLFLRRLQQALQLPLVLHFMDDWAENNYRNGWMAKFYLRPRFEATFRELVQSAPVSVAICREMAEEYEKRYQRPVLWLPMPVELDAYQAAARTQWTAGRPFRLRYGGRVGWAIRDSLTDIARAVNYLRQDGADVALDLATFQTEQVPAACMASNGVSVQTPGPLAEVPRLQAAADALVVCYDFDPKSIRQARYSMPGKMAGCMASGTPILVYGPAGSPVVEYARREGWGRVVDRPDPAALRTAIGELMESSALRERLGRTAQKLAAERHDDKVVSEKMRRILTAARNRQPSFATRRQPRPGHRREPLEMCMTDNRSTSKCR